MRLMVSEIINNASKLNRQQAIEYLRANDSVPLQQVLKIGCCETVQVVLPEGDPPYHPSQAVESHGMFFSNARKLYLFVKGGNDNLNAIKRETLFIQLLESVHPDDARMLLLMKDKKLPIDPQVANEAFPDLQIIPIKRKEPEVKKTEINLNPIKMIKEAVKEVLPTKNKKRDTKIIKLEDQKKKRGRKKKEDA